MLTTFNQNQHTDTFNDNIDELIYINGLYSMEYYQHKEKQEQLQQVLRNIFFVANKGEVWSVMSPVTFESKLLLDIVANIKPYQKGKCVLAQRGMMREKRIILPHLFYIASTNMMYNNMNVLEYLMLITGNSKKDSAIRQLKILNDLINLDLSFISLTAISDLTPQEKSIILLLVSQYLNSKIVIWNLPRLKYSNRLITIASKIIERLKNNGSCVLFSTNSPKFAQALSTHILVLNNGTVQYRGDVYSFTHCRDYLTYTIFVDSLDSNTEVLEKLKEKYDFIYRKKRIYIYKNSDIIDILIDLKEYGIIPTKVEQNIPNIKNSLNTMWRRL